jgi:hypothetical protein
MGFTILEKHLMQKMIRSPDETLLLFKAQIDEDILTFLKKENLLKQISDYGLFPSKYRNLNRAENIVISKFFDFNFDIVEFLSNLAISISGPFTLQIDCSMVIRNDKSNADISQGEQSIVVQNNEWLSDDNISDDEYTDDQITLFDKEFEQTEEPPNEISGSTFRYVWAQRNLAFNEIQRIEHKQDMFDLINEVQSFSPTELMRKIYSIHQTQSCFDKSGYRPVRLLSTVFFMTKF